MYRNVDSDRWRGPPQRQTPPDAALIPLFPLVLSPLFPQSCTLLPVPPLLQVGRMNVRKPLFSLQRRKGGREREREKVDLT